MPDELCNCIILLSQNIMSLLQIIRKKYYRMKGMRDPNEKYGYKHPTAYVSPDATIYSTENLYIEEKCTIYSGSIIMNPRSKVIFKKRSGASHNLTVVPGNHLCLVGKWKDEVTDDIKDQLLEQKEFDQDIIVDEDVWMGVNVTLLNGVHIGRGCIVGAGSVVRNNTPPYSIVAGNPAKIVGFVFSPEEIIKHEKKLFPEEERLSIEVLQKNYERYFLNRISEIKGYMKL